MISPVLKSENVELVPFSEPWNMEYLWSLIQQYRFNTVKEKAAFEAVQEFGRYYWLGYTQAGLTGVLYLNFHPAQGIWTLDAYRDDRMLRKVREQKTWSFEAGKLVCKFFFDSKICDILYTMHREENILATRICERLGFEKCKNFLSEHYTLLLKRRFDDGD